MPTNLPEQTHARSSRGAFPQSALTNERRKKHSRLPIENGERFAEKALPLLGRTSETACGKHRTAYAGRKSKNKHRAHGVEKTGGCQNCSGNRTQPTETQRPSHTAPTAAAQQHSYNSPGQLSFICAARRRQSAPRQKPPPPPQLDRWH